MIVIPIAFRHVRGQNETWDIFERVFQRLQWASPRAGEPYSRVARRCIPADRAGSEAPKWALAYAVCAPLCNDNYSRCTSAARRTTTET